MKRSENGVEFPPFRLDVARRSLMRAGSGISLPRKAFDTLAVLVERRGEIVPKDELLKRVWQDSFVEENSLNQSISAIRKALGDSASEPRFIETVPGIGYRFVAELTEASVVPAATLPRSVAVLPLRTLGPEPEEWLGIGIADTLIARLSNVRTLVVRSTSAVLRIGADSSPAEVGRALGVDAVLEGSIRRAGDRIRVTVQLVSVERESPIWAGTFDESFTEIFAVEDSISERVAEALTTRLTAEERTRLTHRDTENSDVYRLYLNARWHANRLTLEGSEAAIECLRQAVALDPGYALGYAGLAYLFLQCADLTMSSREAMTRAEEAARKALALDGTLVDARAALAAVHWFYDWDADAATGEFERAVALDRRNALARRLFGWCLVLMGRAAQGVAELRVAAEIDTHSHENALYVGPGLYFARRYEEAEESIRDAIARDPGLWVAQAIRGRLAEVQGDLATAIEAYEHARRVDDSIMESLGDLGRALGRSGKSSRARKVLAELTTRARTTHVPAFVLANVHLGLGDYDRAFAALHSAIDERSWYVTWLDVDPMLDELRRDPRWQTLRKSAMRVSPGRT